MRPIADKFKAWINGQLTHPFYKSTVTYYNDLKVHAYGEYPKELIEERRPTESKDIQEFRQKIFQSPTQGVMDKVFNSTTKIRKASDYQIDFSRSKLSPRVTEEESPENYCLSEYPKYTSVDNWIWSVAHKQGLIDVNAFSLVVPPSLVEDNQYLKPYSTIYNSPNVIDYVNDEWCFLLSNEVVNYAINGNPQDGKVYIYADRESIITYTQTSNVDYRIDELPNITGKLPVVRFRGVVEKETKSHTLYRSRIHSMLPYLKEATREYSDLQGAVVQSVFPTYWYMASPKCGKCGGIGKIPKANGVAGDTKCSACSGKGEFPFNPYEHISINVKATELGKNPPPIPPGGIIEKDTKVIEIQDKRIDAHLYKALKAVNMEHLDSTPLNQSGTAKEWDRSEGNNFVSAIAEDIVWFADSTIELICDWRYSVLVPEAEKRDEMLPVINVPVKFDIATDSAIAEDIKRMKDAKMNPSIIAAAEAEYAARLFNANPDIADAVTLQHQLDPLACKSADDIISETQQGWISKESGVIHANIKSFVEQAMFEQKDFAKLPLNTKKETMLKYAKEFISANSTTAKVIDMTQQFQGAAANN